MLDKEESEQEFDDFGMPLPRKLVVNQVMIQTIEKGKQQAKNDLSWGEDDKLVAKTEQKKQTYEAPATAYRSIDSNLSSNNVNIFKIDSIDSYSQNGYFNKNNQRETRNMNAALGTSNDNQRAHMQT